MGRGPREEGEVRRCSMPNQGRGLRLFSKNYCRRSWHRVADYLGNHMRCRAEGTVRVRDVSADVGMRNLYCAPKHHKHQAQKAEEHRPRRTA